MIKRLRKSLKYWLPLAVFAIASVPSMAFAVLDLDGSETPAGAFGEVWTEYKAQIFGLMAAVFGVAIVVALFKLALNKGLRVAKRA